MSNLVQELFKIENYDSVISQECLRRYNLVDLNTAYNQIHFPSSINEVEMAQNRIDIENIVKEMAAFRLINNCIKRAYRYKDVPNFVSRAEKLLPFKLTKSQSEAIEKIKESLVNSDKPLNAMLIGDVSSGKTVVATLASLFALYSSCQVAVMAPTEILAKQHYKTFNDYISAKGVKIALLTGSMSPKEKQLVHKDIKEGRVNIVIGTHALLSESVEFKYLALVVLDEQHRFGVAQRTSLLSKGIACDLISLSATPIPRSLRMTLFGNVEVLNIERRSDASNIKTQVVSEKYKNDVFNAVAKKCIQGEQAYIVAPRIFDVEGVETNSVEKLYVQLKRKYSKEINVGYIHGNMKNDEKNKIMEDFRTNKIAMLISTSLIEVGVDVANATQMIIMDAERFGLSALHQLRGRVGRAGQEANCYLVTEHDDSSRLTFLEKETDGIKIAEMDYELRGPGEWLGERQSGRMMDNISLETLKLCNDLAQSVDLNKNYDLLFNYAIDNGLNRISLN
jgi:ATP-dependent DNA helicase RecG